MTIKGAATSAVLLLTVMLAACSTDAVSPVAPTNSADGTTGVGARVAPFWGGVFLGESESTPERVFDALTQFTAATGKRPALVKTFHNLDAALAETGWAGRVLRSITSAGSTNYVALDLGWAGRPSGSLLEAISRGDADAAIDRAARSLSTVSGVVLVEPAWEMNGNWNYAWQGVANGSEGRGPQLYVSAWRRVADRFRAVGATNVRWVWNPNTGNSLAGPGAGSSHWNWYANYYPGDAYVDFVGAHGYNGPTVFNTRYHTFAQLFGGVDADYMLHDLKERFPNKPIILGEMGAEETPGNDKGAWIRDAYSSMMNDPRIVGAVWFNMNKEADWRVSSSSSSAAAYRAMMSLSAVRDSYDDSVVGPRAVMVAQR
jgi:hypothetical protein